MTLREVQLPQVYGYVNALDKAPDLLLSTNTPDGAHPDLWARILFSSKGGLNFLGYSDKRIDALLDEAYGAGQAKADDLYREAGRRFVDGDGLFFLGAVKDVFVLRKDLDGTEHVLAYPWTLAYGALKRGGRSGPSHDRPPESPGADQITARRCPRISMWQSHTFDPASLPGGAGIPDLRAARHETAH